jgi:glycosyltransferase involved in cell wall biosynthesis
MIKPVTNPELSIIIPTLNEEESIGMLLKAIKRQTYKSLEVIIADAGSTDRTCQIAKKYGCRVIEGGTPSIGRNRGAAVARGKYLLFLDADVLFERDFVAEMLEEFELKGLDVASCGVVSLSDKTVDIIMQGVTNAYILATQFFYPHAPGFCILIRKDVHDRIKGFDESLKLAEDHDYVIRAKEYGRFRILKNIKIFVSVRRFESDGRLNVATKYILCEAYRLVKGEIKTDVFKYKFGHHKKKKATK